MTTEEDIVNRFSAADYVVFVVVIVISASIGFVFGWVDRKKKSTKDFLLGGGDLRVFPVGISMMASFTSAIAILGFSSEMYLYGTQYWIVVLSYPFTQGLAALVYVPLFHGLKLTTAYQVALLLQLKSFIFSANIILILLSFLSTCN
jgi:sodium-coupled monocarboxylate transporter 8/12